VITTSTVVNSVVEKLRAALARGQWRSGDMLPGQRELAEQLGISRPSLREAVIVLETLGLVRSMPGKGVVVLDAQLSDSQSHDGAVAGPVSKMSCNCATPWNRSSSVWWRSRSAARKSASCA
jgi:GntR family transcriptional repressor for pyruvate dehydrogenase complex